MTRYQATCDECGFTGTYKSAGVANRALRDHACKQRTTKQRTTRPVLDHRHGVNNARCGHPDCQAAIARYGKRWRLDRARGFTRLVGTGRVRAHIASCHGAGMSTRAVAAAAGVGAGTVSKLARGQARVRVDVARRILTVKPGVTIQASRSTREPFVPRVGTVRRIQAMLALGWTHRHISEAAGLPVTATSARSGVLLSQQGRWVTLTTHQAIAAAYRQLSAQQGPSEKTRGRARALGYHNPFAWDDIDNDTEPDLDTGTVDLDDDYLDDAAIIRRMAGDHSIRLTTTENRELVARWQRTGRSLNECERVTGLKPERYIDRTTAA